MQFGNNIRHFVDGAGKLPGILDKAGQVPQSQLSLQKEHTAQQAHHGQGHVVDEIHTGAGDGAVGLRHGVGVHRLGVLFIASSRP